MLIDSLFNITISQNRYTAEIEALQRSIEQREKAAKELHGRIRQLEEAEITLTQNNASLSLKVHT